MKIKTVEHGGKVFDRDESGGSSCDGCDLLSIDFDYPCGTLCDGKHRFKQRPDAGEKKEVE